MWHWSNICLQIFLWFLGGLFLFTMPEVPPIRSEYVPQFDHFFPVNMFLTLSIPIVCVLATSLLYASEKFFKEKLSAVDYRMVILFLTLVEVGIYLRVALRWIDGINYAVIIGTMMFCIYLYQRLPSLKLNRLIGVRVPWTLKDEVVWDKTHRKLSVWMAPTFWLGFVAFVMPQFVWVYFTTFVLVNLAAIPYSWWVFRSLKSKSTTI
tara:strand:+ start:1372 stop:1995 length:624 start_codon:yes stop_codon:yes gene_type:complete